MHKGIGSESSVLTQSSEPTGNRDPISGVSACNNSSALSKAVRRLRAI